MKSTTAIRNRIQHLDEDIFNGANCSERHPVLGAVSWADARVSGGQLTDVDDAGDVVDFWLMAADQMVKLDELMNALTNFMGAFEVTVSRPIISIICDAAMQKGVSLEEPRPHGIADMTMAMRMRRKPEGWECDNGDGLATVEVPFGYFDISDKPRESGLKNSSDR